MCSSDLNYFVFDSFTSAFFHFGSIEDNITVNDIFRDSENNIWMASYGSGIFCFQQPIMTNYTTGNGLSSNFTYSIQKGQANKIWIIHQRGVDIIEDGKIKKITNISQGASVEGIVELSKDWVIFSNYAKIVEIKKEKKTEWQLSDRIFSLYKDKEIGRASCRERV